MPQSDATALVNGLLIDPIDFLTRNLIWIVGDVDVPPGCDTRRFDVAAQPFSPSNPNRQSTGGRLYEIRPSQTGSLMAHFLPWGYDTGYYIILERHSPASIMLTDQLTGCAVGYITAPDGAIRLSHHNILLPSGSTNQPAMKDSLSFATAANSGSAIHPEHYFYRQRALDPDKNEVFLDGRAIVVAAHQPNEMWRVYVQRLQVAKADSDSILDIMIRDAFQI